MNLAKIFADNAEEHRQFDRVTNKRSNRPDLHAFMLLDGLCPGKKDIIASASHDEIYLSIEPEELAKVASEEQVVELIRCGIRYDAVCECLQMFV